MTISGGRTEQLNIFCRVTGFTSDFLSFIVVEHIRFFHGALQFSLFLRLDIEVNKLFIHDNYCLLVTVHLTLSNTMCYINVPSIRCQMIKLHVLHCLTVCFVVYRRVFCNLHIIVISLQIAAVLVDVPVSLVRPDDCHLEGFDTVRWVIGRASSL